MITWAADTRVHTTDKARDVRSERPKASVH